MVQTIITFTITRYETERGRLWSLIVIWYIIIPLTDLLLFILFVKFLNCVDDGFFFFGCCWLSPSYFTEWLQSVGRSFFHQVEEKGPSCYLALPWISWRSITPFFLFPIFLHCERFYAKMGLISYLGLLDKWMLIGYILKVHFSRYPLQKKLPL